MSIIKKAFGEYQTCPVYKYLLSNGTTSVEISNYGATVLSIKTPDKSGNVADVVCGYDELRSYIEADGYQGAIIGRVCNRIRGGRFKLDGVEYTLARNDGPNHLHGGSVGFDKRVWNVESVVDSSEPTIKFSLISADGEEGYPGKLNVSVTYSLTKDNGLSIRYEATTDKRTILNLTNHTYFNLGGCGSGNIHGHVLWLDADTYLPTDETLIPTGEIKDVTGTPFDFREPKTIGRDICANDRDLTIAHGYDHCFNFVGGEPKSVKFRAKVSDAVSGRVMEMYTNQPCVQLYTGNELTNEKYPFKGGVRQAPQTAFCMETQHMADSINHANFTSVVLEPRKKYDYTTIYKFYAE